MSGLDLFMIEKEKDTRNLVRNGEMVSEKLELKNLNWD